LVEEGKGVHGSTIALRVLIVKWLLKY